MRTASFRLVVSVIAVVALASSAPAATRTEVPAFRYLASMVPHYPEDVAVRMLQKGGVQVFAAHDGWIVFGTSGRTRLTPHVRRLPFLKAVYSDAAAVMSDPKLRDLPIARVFLRVVGEARAKSLASSPRSRALDGAGAPLVLSGVPGVTKTMLDLDAMLRRLGSGGPSRPTDGIADDPYEPNDTFETAIELTPGTYTGLQCRDDDWFKVTVAEGSDLVVTIEFDPSGGWPSFSLYDAGRNELMWSSGGSTGRGAVWVAHAAAGTYYFGVYPFGGPGYSATVRTGAILGSVSGTVTAQASGSPLAGITVEAMDAGGDVVAVRETDAGGGYAIPLPAGDYKLHFSIPYDMNFLPEFYDGRSDLDSADPVTVAEGAATDIDAALTAGGIVRGGVSDEISGSPLGDVWVFAYDAAGDYVDGDITTGGAYEIDRLTTGSYKLRAEDAPNNFGEWYHDKSSFAAADAVQLAAGAVASDIDFALARAGSIAGRITDLETGAGLGGSVDVLDSAGAYKSFGYVNPDGFYEAQGLPTGSMRVRFFPGGDYVPEWFDRRVSFETATPVAVTAGQVTPGIDAQVRRAGRISGHVRRADGSGFGSVVVRAFDASGTETGYNYSDSYGFFRVFDLPPGSYRLWFDGAYSGAASEWFADRGSIDQADPVVVVSGGETNVEAVLSPGGSLRLDVLSPTGMDVSPVLVSVFDSAQRRVATSVSDGGILRIGGLPAANLRLFLDPVYVPGRYLPTWFDRKTTFAGATPVPVAAGAETTIHASLLPATSLEVTSPASGAVWPVRTIQSIAWTKTGAQASTVKVQLIRGTAVAATIAASTANDGALGWTVPASLPAGAGYRVKVATTDGRVSGTSGMLTISVPSITFVGPAAGTVWARGTPQTISWTVSGSMASTVKIQLFKGTTLVKTIASSAANTGTYGWTVPRTIATGANYRVKIVTTDGKVKATSAAFTIN